MTPRCPNCRTKLEINISPCLDNSCCGIEHDISCANYMKCKWYGFESFSMERIVEKWKEMGGTLDGILDEETRRRVETWDDY